MIKCLIVLTVLIFCFGTVFVSVLSAGEFSIQEAFVQNEINDEQVIIDWGDISKTDGDTYCGITNYSWIISAKKSDGFWVGEDASCWYASPYANEETALHTLSVKINPVFLCQKAIRYSMFYYGFPGSEIEVDFFDQEGRCIQENALENLITATNTLSVATFCFSGREYPGCAEIRLVHTAGTLLVYRSVLSVLDARFAGMSNEKSSSRCRTEAKRNAVSSMYLSNTDGTSSSTGAQCWAKQNDVVHISALIGCDFYDGERRIIIDGHGPKKTIQAGLSCTYNNQTLEISTGIYVIPEINPGERSVTLVPNGHVAL